MIGRKDTRMSSTIHTLTVNAVPADQPAHLPAHLPAHQPACEFCRRADCDHVADGYVLIKRQGMPGYTRRMLFDPAGSLPRRNLGAEFARLFPGAIPPENIVGTARDVSPAAYQPPAAAYQPPAASPAMPRSPAKMHSRRRADSLDTTPLTSSR